MSYQPGKLRVEDLRRPRIYFTPANIDALRRKRHRAPLDILYAKMVDEAEKWADTELPEEPRNFPEPCTFRYGDPFDGEILAEITTRTQGMARPALLINGFLYQLTGDEVYARETRRWLLHVCGWDVEGSSGVWGNDIQAATMGMAMACAYDWIHSILSAEERRLVRANLAARARQMFTFLTPVEQIYNGEYCNHAWMDASCAILSAIAVFDEVPDAAKWIDHMVDLFQHNFLPKGYPDGSWHEFSSYWTTAFLYGVCFVADPLRDCCGVDLYDNEWLRRGGEYVTTAIDSRPDLRLAFGDAGYGYNSGELLALEKWALEYDRPEGRWSYAARRDDPQMLGMLPFSYLWMEPGAEIARPTWTPKKRYQSGEVFLRSGWAEDAVAVGFTAGPYVGHQGYSHAHADQNSFMLHAYGERLLIDGGIYDYWGSEHYSGYYTTSLAHNTVLVEGKGQRAMTPHCEGEILEFVTGDDVDYLRAEAARAYGNPDLQSFTRQLWFVENRYLVLCDDLRASRPMEFTWLFHSLFPMDLSRDRVVLQGPRAGALLQFFAPQDLDMKLSQGFPIEPTHRPSPDYEEYHLSAKAPQGTAVRLVTVIVPFRQGTDPDRIEITATGDGTVHPTSGGTPPGPPATASVPRQQ